MRKYMLLCAIPLFCACHSNEKKIDNIKLDIVVQRLDKDMQSLTPENIPAVRERYGHFFELFNTSIIGIGNSENPLYFDMLQNFLQHGVVKEAYKEVARVFSDEKILNVRFTNAFKHVSYYFPDMEIPKVIAYISGFNEAIMLTDSAIGIGLDRFLGSNYANYSHLGFPRYLQQSMCPERIVIMAVQAWLASEYTVDFSSESTLLKNMLHEGKILYALKQSFPDETDSLLMGYAKLQYEWCVENEQQMWETLIAQKYLYTTNQFIIQKFIGDAPFTAEFSSAAPGKACNWIAYRIISAYMKQNPDVAFPALMEEKDAQKILRESRYNPK